MTAFDKTIVQEDTSVPVAYPRKPNGVYPNHYAFMFMYAPAFAFHIIPRAVSYRYEAIDDFGSVHTFRCELPDRPLSPIWNELPVGTVKLTVFGEDDNGGPVGIAGYRIFWKKAQYVPGSYEKKKRSYRETASLIFDNRFNSPEVTEIIAGQNPKVNYPTKQLAAIINCMKHRMLLCPETKAESLTVLTATADLLMSLSQPRGAALAGFSPTYHPSEKPFEWEDPTMLLYPAFGIDAFLNAYECTGDRKYLAFAELGANTFVKMQGEDGSWPLVVSQKDGRPLTPNRCVPLWHMEVFRRLFSITGNTVYRDAEDRAFRYFEQGPLSDWNWEGQFEDTLPTQPFLNLTKHDACSVAIYLTERYPEDRQRIACARELLRFAEDLFVNWEKPFCNGNVLYPEKGFGYYNHYWDMDKWIMPAVFEQYGCFTPVDASAAKLIRTYLALYRAEGNPLDLAKAKTLGDAATRMTDDDGLESTWWNEKDRRQDIWPNCMIACAVALTELIPYAEDNPKQ